jgi:2-C-methyl-D-erythritol 2,4-cyclodiphosphate synthase/2-C-methyl-D-erythritol 4-phosphate cytidylyltransferase
LPKQFFPVAGLPLLAHTLRCLERHPRVGPIALILPAAELDELGAPRRFSLAGFSKVERILAGGATRQESVARGLAALDFWEGPLLVQDGARPCTPPEVIDRVIDGVLAWGSAAAAIPVRDTVKRATEGGLVRETLDRQDLWQTQTPQGFQIQLLREAHERAAAQGLRATDDIGLLEALGIATHLVLGDPLNIKVTYPEDLALAEAILARADAGEMAGGAGGERRPHFTAGEMRARQSDAGEMRGRSRVGYGYDVHSLRAGIPLMLGGVAVPWEKGLLGHSDGDVMLHAIMDALLGAAALGDIGAHFPDTDPQYKGCASLSLLARVGEKLSRAGCEISNIDCTLAAERPKIQAYIPAMRRSISQTLAIPETLVSVKATTEEGLGFVGRGEGMACHAVCALIQR